MLTHRLFPLLSCLMVLLAWDLSSCAAEQSELEFFEKKIRPVLIEHCYQCHSEASEAIKGGLVVDHRDGLLAGGDSGPSIEPGKPDDSLLLSSLKYESYEMPPAGKLPDDVIRDFEQWIANGAIDPRKPSQQAKRNQGIDWEAARQFWAFKPLPTEPIPAEMTAEARARRIDGFVDQSLQAKQISPNPAAAPEKRLRRLYFDLVGMPPTPQEILEFTADPTPQRWAETVERLLESPQFGEKWGRHWLDVARYADSNGGDFNATFHNAWRYRDYVIEAYNKDMPIDQFFREQIAGDLLPASSDADRRQKIVATGFLMVGPKMLSERDKEKLKYDVIDEQIDSFGKAFLGLSLGCARCHDHKFDPVPTADYYALAGIFQGTQVLNGEMQPYVSDWLRRDLPTSAEHLAQVQQYQQQLTDLKARQQSQQKLIKRHEQVVEQVGRGAESLVVDNTQAILTGEWKSSNFTAPFHGADYIHDNKLDKGNKQVKFPAKLQQAGTYQILFGYVPSSGRDKRVPVDVLINGESQRQFVDQTKKPTIQQLYVSLGEFEINANADVAVVVSNAGTTDYVIADAVQFVRLPQPGDTPTDQAELTQAQAKLAELQQELKTLEADMKRLQAQAPPAVPQAIAVQDYEVCENCTIMIRGEHTNPGKLVPRGALKIISGEQAALDIMHGSGRLELADWLIRDASALTSRVYVNRIWTHLLGEGLVNSVDNFGTQGIPPTHPELLDDLALQFLDAGWSTKQLIRAIVQTNAYQRSTQHQEQAYQLDPENRLLWRGFRRPLTAEEIRDTLHLLQKKLDLTPGGSGVAQMGRLAVNNSNQANLELAGQTLFRRSVYQPVIRNQLDEISMLFDFANPEMVVGKRPVTNVPSQALYLLNHPQTRNTARTLVDQMFEQYGEGSFSSLNDLYLLIFGRLPAQADDALLHAYVEQKLQGQVESDQVRSAWCDVVQALLISSEFRYLD